MQGCDIELVQTDTSQPRNLNNSFTVQVTTPSALRRGVDYKVYTVIILGDFEKESLQILCFALFDLGYIFSYPIDSKTVGVLSQHAPPDLAQLKKKSLLACSIETEYKLLPDKILQYQLFQSAYIRAIYMSLISHPDWSASYTAEQSEGVIMTLDETITESEEVKRYISVSLISLNYCGDGNLLLSSTDSVSDLISMWYHVDKFSLSFKIGHRSIRPYTPRAMHAFLCSTGDPLLVSGLSVDILAPADICNRKRGYRMYLPGSYTEMMSYVKYKWGMKISTKEVNNLVKVTFLHQNTEAIIPTAMLTW